MSYNKNNSRAGIVAGVVIIVIILLIIPIFIGIVSLFMGQGISQTEIGLMKNSQNNKVYLDQDPYQTGKYYPEIPFLGISFGEMFFGGQTTPWFRSFKTYPTSALELRFEDTKGADSLITGPKVNGNSFDGLAYTCSLYMVFYLDSSNIAELYRAFPADGWKTAVRETTRATARNVMSEHVGVEFFNNRSQIEDDLFERLQTKLTDYYVYPTQLSLKSIDLPEEFDQALLDKQNAKQAVETAQFRKEEAVVEAEISIINAEADRNITILMAEGEAEAVWIAAQAEAKGLAILYDTRLNATQDLKNTLNMTNAEILSYLYILAIQEHDSAWLIIGGDGTGILLTGNATSLAAAGDIFETVEGAPSWDDDEPPVETPPVVVDEEPAVNTSTDEFTSLPTDIILVVIVSIGAGVFLERRRKRSPPQEPKAS